MKFYRGKKSEYSSIETGITSLVCEALILYVIITKLWWCFARDEFVMTTSKVQIPHWEFGNITMQEFSELGFPFFKV